MDLNLSPRYLFATFAMLYFVQGVIQAYQLNFFKPHMDSEGIDAPRQSGGRSFDPVRDQAVRANV